jgi:hypothetical protein
MPAWAAASVAYFIYIAVVAAALRGLTPLARTQAMVGAASGALLAVLGSWTTDFWLRLVVLPPMTLLVAYWCSGLLWVGPMKRIEGFFIRSDLRLRVPQAAARLPRAASELLELAYAGIYPLIPVALVLHLLHAPKPDADRFWTVILVTDFICFGMLPWVQTRPPRALDAGSPWRSTLRHFNLRLLGETSIGVNTVPSGHAAEALAVALLLTGAPWPVAASMWLAALAVSAGAVLGRYHFALDAAAGWAVALAVWTVVAVR